MVNRIFPVLAGLAWLTAAAAQAATAKYLAELKALAAKVLAAINAKAPAKK